MSVSINPIQHVASIAKQSINCWKNTLITHPKLSLVVQAALASLSVATYSKPDLLTVSKLSAASAIFLGASLTYHWSHLFREIWHGLLNRPYEPSFGKVFKEDQFLNENQEVLAKITYKGNLPIFKFSSLVDIPSERGYIHGYLMAEQIIDIGKKALRPMIAFLQWEKGENGDKALKQTIERLTIPDEVKEELLGVVKGVQCWCLHKKKQCPKEVETYIFAAHVMTDHYKAIGSSLGCSAVVNRHVYGAPIVVGRNLDWVSMGYLGRHLFVRKYDVKTDKRNREVSSFSFPGYIGGLTVWNSDGLVVMINELGKTSKQIGKPYSIMAKELIEHCGNVKEATDWLEQHQKQSPCASSVSLILADANDAKLYHYYPEGADDIIIKELADRGRLTVTNHAHDDEDNLLLDSICERKSIERLKRLEEGLFIGMQEAQHSLYIVESALKAAGVAATVGVFIADLSTGRKKLVFDDFFAHHQLDKQPYLRL